jgi:MiaB-like tRNA modifying enzyme
MQVFVKSFGCSTNLTDGQVLAGCLAEAGHVLVGSVLSADVVVCNTCAVKGPTESRMISVLKKVPADKKLVVAGCLPLINFERLNREVRFDGVAGPATGEGIVDVVRRVADGERVVALHDACEAMPRLSLPRVRPNSVISIIPISYGCLGSCAYCCVTLARGRLRSYSGEEIVQRARKDIDEGAREIWLTSQDAACYGKDRNTDLAELLDSLCKIEGKFRIRVGMMTPNAALSILDGLVQAFRDEHVFRFLHVPVQSGDDGVLKRMRRFYTVSDFKKVVNAFRGDFPELTLSTDVICGFPGETEEAFGNTLRLIEEVKPDMVNVSKFFARPRTTAAEMQEGIVPAEEIRRRSGVVSKLTKKITLERNRLWVGWTGEILIDEAGKVRGSWVGRNFAYKPVAVKGSRGLLGRTVNVKVVEAFQAHLPGEIVE